MSIRQSTIDRPRYGRPFSIRRPSTSGFTLVELMVALALAAMISVAIMVISNQAREVYEATARKVEVYNKFRFALLSMDRDFSRWIPTSNLEFFIDGRGSNSRRNQNWSPGEELPDTRDERGPGVVDGGTFKDYDEFAYILERHYLGEEKDGTWKIHDAYQMYFRTMTFVEGRTREANVEYMLLDPTTVDSFQNPLPPVKVSKDKMRELTLYKIVRYHDIKPGELDKPAMNFPIVRKWVEVCSNVTDFRLEYTTDNRFDRKVNASFRTPAEDFRQPAEVATQPLKVPQLDNAFKKVFGYGSSKLQVSYEKATGFREYFGDRQTRNEHRPTRFGFEQNPRMKFAELTPGDRIFIFTESAMGGQVGGNQGVAGNAANLTIFPAGIYTVKTNIAGKLEFVEDIDSNHWSRDANAVRFTAAFLPEALRITIRVVEEESKIPEPKTLQRVVWVRQKAR